ncbi:BSD domain-containing protein 1 [Coemansia nantahalensis]|uniref:BSD domain-containing protein 1 n=2 Tax=Coemansia TaxID=4863 RepID=A0ACC1KTQ2_9FUNG|nr:BSD domain-containing protein 1 [Coemansia nantahalensis]KAJ2775347.1 BSD domain-containing protein 1 [Coemansia nantahalensis]KAJ2794770.1 BSD domain-containing protein 1 [Coemansia helicoidea]
MDDLTFQIAADAAASEAGGSEAAGEQPAEGLSFGAMFGAAASWGKRVKAELQLGQLVDQARKQSEEVSRAYTQDIAEFAQAVKTGATKGIDELSTRLGQLTADAQEELEDSGSGNPEGERAEGPFAELRRRLQADGEKTRRLMSRVGTDLEGFLREAIVIEAPAENRVVYDRRMAQLAQLQEAEDTFLDDPSDGAQAAEFAAFGEAFSLDSQRAEVARLLSQANVAAVHARLVPDRVAETDFWARYFFRAWLVDQEELRRKKLVDDAVAATAADADDVGWGSDDGSDAEAPPAQPAQPETAEPAEPQVKDTQPEAAPAATPAAPEPADKDGGDNWDEWE